jgi:hypothetical protein
MHTIEEGVKPQLQDKPLLLDHTIRSEHVQDREEDDQAARQLEYSDSKEDNNLIPPPGSPSIPIYQGEQLLNHQTYQP